VNGIESGPDGATGEENVIDQDHDLAIQVFGEFGWRFGQYRPNANVVTVERNVKAADRRSGGLNLLHRIGEPESKRHPAGLQTYEHYAVGAMVALNNFVSHAPDGPL